MKDFLGNTVDAGDLIVLGTTGAATMGLARVKSMEQEKDTFWVTWVTRNVENDRQIVFAKQRISKRNFVLVQRRDESTPWAQ